MVNSVLIGIAAGVGIIGSVLIKLLPKTGNWQGLQEERKYSEIRLANIPSWVYVNHENDQPLCAPSGTNKNHNKTNDTFSQMYMWKY